jgi:hypothetical protein
MKILWALVALAAALFLLGIVVTLPQLIGGAILVYALGATTWISKALREAAVVALVLLSFAPTARAEDVYPNLRRITQVKLYDADSATMEFCSSLGKKDSTSGGTSRGADYKAPKRIKTAGSDTVTVSKDSGAAAFALLFEGDIIATYDSDGKRQERVVITKTSDDEIEVSSAWDLSPTGVEFYWRHVVCGDAEASGEILVDDLSSFQLRIRVRQMVVDTGTINAVIQCRDQGDDEFLDIETVQIASAGTCEACFLTRVITGETYEACRVGFLVTDDDADDTGANAEQIEVVLSGKRAVTQ